MAAGSTYTPIATQTLSSTTYTVTFNSIPQTYTDLILISNGNTIAGPTDNGLRFNNDTSTTCPLIALYGDGSSASGYRTSATYIPINGLYWSGGNSTRIVHIFNYANTTTYKTILARCNNGNLVSANVGLWPVTSAITRIDINAGGSDFTSGTTFTLYGIAAA
jgi:hypothetical protein